MELDDAYANGAYIENADSYPPQWQAEAAGLRERLSSRAEIGLSYGDQAREVFDLFHPESDAAGTLVFVHGGYWLKFDRTYWSHLAQGALEAGWAVGMPSYTLVPQNTIAGITTQIAAAVTTIAERTVGPISLAGHSAGGHLVARMLAPGMLPLDVAGRIACVVPISPLADLEPLLKTSMNKEFGLDAEGARAESPVHQPAPDIPVTVWVGEQERPAFLDQARWLAEAWDVPRRIEAGRHHFDVIEDLAREDSDLTRLLTGG